MEQSVTDSNSLLDDQALERDSTSSFVSPPENWAIETYLRIKPCPQTQHHELASYSTQGKRDSRYIKVCFTNSYSTCALSRSLSLSSYSTVVNLDAGEKKELISIEIPLDADPGLLHNNSYSGLLQFQFDQIFDVSATQNGVFTVVAKSKIEAIFDGINSTIFAYGQTGSG